MRHPKILEEGDDTYYIELAGKANNFPLEYLQERTSGVAWTMPDLENQAFNETLLKAMQNRGNSE